MSDAEGDKNKRNELARDRTAEANRRTQLANERTFSAWIRTGLALLVSGFAATRLLDETGPAWLLSAVGVVLAALSALSFAIALLTYRKAHDPEVDGRSHIAMGLIVMLLVVVSACGVFLILNA
jgi:putative membrane protein